MARQPRETPQERRQRLREQKRLERKKAWKRGRNGALHQIAEMLAEATRRR